MDILFFTFFFLKKLWLVLLGQSSRILIQLLLFLFYSLKMTKLGRNVTNKYGQIFPQVNCPFIVFLFRLYSSTSINNLLNLSVGIWNLNKIQEKFIWQHIVSV